MPDYELTFIHKGRQRVAVISGDDHKDAFEALQSIRENAVIGDEIVMIVPFPELQGEMPCQ